MAWHDNKLSKDFEVAFESIEEMFGVLHHIGECCKENGFIRVTDITPDEHGYLQNYGWHNGVLAMVLDYKKLTISIKNAYCYLGGDEGIGVLDLNPRIVDILSSYGITTLDKLKDAYPYKHLSGIGPVYSEEIVAKYNRFLMEKT